MRIHMTRAVPPARSLASSLCSWSSAQASSRLVGARYSNLAFMVQFPFLFFS